MSNASPFIKAFLRLILVISPWLLSVILQKLQSLQREIVKFWDEIRKLSKDFKNFKDKIVEKMTSEAKAASTSSTPPNEQDVQFLSDGYDDLVKSAKGVSEEFKKKLVRRLNAFEFHVSNIVKAIDNILFYSYQYNVKITAWRTLLVYTNVTPCLMHDSRSRKGTVFLPRHGKKTCKGTD